MAPSAECAVCGSPGKLCSRCRVDAYCGPEHQKQDWPRHKAGCGVFELEAGRLRATKDIKKGTVIIKEGPAAVYPAPLPGSTSLFCVGCCFETGHGAASTLQCTLCGLPVCSDGCANAATHQQDECAVFQRARYRMQRRDLERFQQRQEQWPSALAVLRTALAVRRDPRLSSLPTDVTAGRPERKALPDTRTAVWPTGHVNRFIQTFHAAWAQASKNHDRIEKWLRRTVGVTWLSRQELLRAANLVQLHVNGAGCHRPCRMEFRFSEGRLFLGYSQLDHSCLPNVAFVPWKGVQNPAKEHVMVAARDIKAGEYLCKDFLVNGWMKCTLDRQMMLLGKFGFVCRCRRCEDPTELGQYVASPFCPACAKKGERHYLVVSECANFWRCKACGKKLALDEFVQLTREFYNKVQELVKKGADYKECLAFLVESQYPKGPLHAMHEVVIVAKDALRQCIFDYKADREASNLEMKVWEDLCRNLLDAMDALCPGMHEHRLQIVLELRRLLVKHSHVANQVADALQPAGVCDRDTAKKYSDALKRKQEKAQALLDFDNAEFDQYRYGLTEEEFYDELVPWPSRGVKS